MSKRQQAGRALFYSRGSGGRHEMSLPEYVEWARRQAQALGLRFDGTAEAITAMVSDRCAHRGDLFLDYGVAGNVLEREGLSALTGCPPVVGKSKGTEKNRARPLVNRKQ